MRASGKGDVTMPPNEECPNCQQVVADWHVEWYKTEGPSLYRGLAALNGPWQNAVTITPALRATRWPLRLFMTPSQRKGSAPWLCTRPKGQGPRGLISHSPRTCWSRHFSRTIRLPC